MINSMSVPRVVRWISIQNGAISLIFKIRKIRNIGFGRRLILNIQEISLMLIALLWRHLLTKHSLFMYYFLNQHNSQVTTSIGAKKRTDLISKCHLFKRWALVAYFIFFNKLSKFVQTSVLSVNKFLNAWCKERCWLLSQPLRNTWLHLSIWCKFLFTWHFLTLNVYSMFASHNSCRYTLDAYQSESDLHQIFAHKKKQ